MTSTSLSLYLSIYLPTYLLTFYRADALRHFRFPGRQSSQGIKQGIPDHLLNSPLLSDLPVSFSHKPARVPLHRSIVALGWILLASL